MRFVNCEQLSHDWFAARCGRITASRAYDFMAKRKRGDGELAAKRDYRIELFCERTTGQVSDHVVTEPMRWGQANEGFARTAYEIETGLVADQIGFLFHPTLDRCGASPDSLVGNDGGLEIKCPASATHLGWVADGVVPEQHKDQMYQNMLCGEREWWDFVSFDPRLPKKLQFFMRRLPRDEKRIAEIESEVLKLDAEVEYLIAQLGVESQLPPIESFCEKRTVKIGAVDVPADIAEMLDQEIVP